MTSNDLRQAFLNFYQKRAHKYIPPIPLVPPNDPTTLFTSAGMQQLVPYLKGQEHPMGTRLVNSQPSFRAEDIQEVGDNRHTTFFEMLGNWSLGDYFKSEQLPWFFEFLTQKVGLSKERLYVTVYSGSKNIPEDKKSIEIWQQILKTKKPAKEGIKGFDPESKIYLYSEENWWSRSGKPQNMPVGEIGGPDSEVFYDFGPEMRLHEKSEWKDQSCHVNCDCGRFLEIGNSVFMEYQKTKSGDFEKLPNKNVDFGGGLERILAAKMNQPDIFKTDLFWPIIQKAEKIIQLSYHENPAPFRVIADHVKAASMMIYQGLKPGNKRQGYVLRRLMRRAAVKMYQVQGGKIADLSTLVEPALKIYHSKFVDSAFESEPKIKEIFQKELSRFSKALKKGFKKIESTSLEKIDGQFAFDLFQTHGFPFEITQEILEQKGHKISKSEFDVAFARHQEKSKTASAGMFKGGLVDGSQATTKLHTATHLLHAALRKVLGDHVEQVGSNITPKRLRFDFTHSQSLSDQEVKKVQSLVNKAIEKDLRISCEVMPLERAKKVGALAFFGQKYPEKVKVYTISDGKGKIFSKELCAGPHVDSTGEINGITIFKEESCGAGKRRVYAKLKS